MTAGSILVVDWKGPDPQRDAASLRMVNLLELLIEAGWDVTFSPIAKAPTRGCSLPALGVHVLPVGSAREHLEEHGGDHDVVFLSRLEAGMLLSKHVRLHAPRALLVYDTVDLAWVRYFRHAKLTGNHPMLAQALKIKRDEMEVVQRADRTLVVSTVERDMLERERPDAEIGVLSTIHEHPGSRRPFGERADVLFVGAMTHAPNVDAAQLLMNEIWPLAAARLPSAWLRIVGPDVTPELEAALPQRAELTGWVEDIDRYYDGCRLSIAPLRFGAGVKGKVLEHMGHGLPVVGTDTAFEGIPVTSGHDALVANTAEEIAQAAVRLYKDEELWARLSANAPRVVEEHFSRAAARRALERVLRPVSRSEAHA